MSYIDIKTAAQKWGLTVRRVQDMCKNGSIRGATRLGRAWMIPEDAHKPIDGRTSHGKSVKSKTEGRFLLPVLRKCPLITYTDIYNTPGKAEDVIAAFSKYSENEKIFRAQFNCQRGDVESVYKDVKYFLEEHNGFYSTINAGLLLAFVAMHKGDVHLWQQARQHIYGAPCETEDDRQVVSFWIAVADSLISDTRDFPDWFKEGRFDCLPFDSFPAARLFYVKYIFITAHDLAVGKASFKDIEKMGLMRTLPYMIEPMISQAKAEKTVVPECQLHLMAATVYHNLGQDSSAVLHIDSAIKLCLPDRLYSALAQYRTELDTLLDDRLALIDSDAFAKVKELHKTMSAGWLKLHNYVLERNISGRLTSRERHVAKLAAFGLSNPEIAKRLHIEVSSVKQYVFSAMNKVGAEKRVELGLYI